MFIIMLLSTNCNVRGADLNFGCFFVGWLVLFRFISLNKHNFCVFVNSFCDSKLNFDFVHRDFILIFFLLLLFVITRKAQRISRFLSVLDVCVCMCTHMGKEI